MPNRWRGGTPNFTRNPLLYHAMIDYWGDLVNYKQEKKMKAILQINMGNAAFGERPATELARILRNIANDVDDHCLQHTGDAVFAIDTNGNSVGKLEIVEDSNV